MGDLLHIEGFLLLLVVGYLAPRTLVLGVQGVPQVGELCEFVPVLEICEPKGHYSVFIDLVKLHDNHYCIILSEVLEVAVLIIALLLLQVAVSFRFVLFGIRVGWRDFLTLKL